VKQLTEKHEFEKLRYAWYRTVVLRTRVQQCGRRVPVGPRGLAT